MLEMLSDKGEGVSLSYDMKDEKISFLVTLVIPAKTIFLWFSNDCKVVPISDTFIFLNHLNLLLQSQAIMNFNVQNKISYKETGKK